MRIGRLPPHLRSDGPGSPVAERARDPCFFFFFLFDLTTLAGQR